MKGRWYDNYPEFAQYLKVFKELKAKKRDKIVQGIIKIMKKEDKIDKINEAAIDFPMDIYKRRWYDEDPYLWLIFNGLQLLDDRKIINEITKYLKQELN